LGALGRERIYPEFNNNAAAVRRPVASALEGTSEGAREREREKEPEKNKNSAATTTGERAGLRLCGETRAQTMLGINRDSAAAVCADLVTPLPPSGPATP